MSPVTVPFPRGHWGVLEDKEPAEPSARFWRAFLPLLLILIAGALAVFQFRSASLEDDLHRTVDTYLDVVQTGLESRLRGLVEDAHLVAAAIATEDATDLGSASVTRVLRAVSDARRDYYEIRIVDADGMERHGVRRMADRTRELTLDELRDVRLHDEFSRSLQLLPGEVYVSQFDLSTSEGRIAEPFRPVLRIVTPLMSSGRQRLGSLVLTFHATPLLDSLTLRNAPGFVELITTDGYWVKARDEPLQWGFALPERRRALFSRLFPRAWEAVIANDRGVTTSKKGRFWFRTISADGAGTGPQNAPRWKLLLHVPVDHLQARRAGLAMSIGGLTFALAIIFAFSQRRAARLRSGDELKPDRSP